MGLSKEYLSTGEKFQQRLTVVRIAISQGTQAAAIRSGISERTVRSWKQRFEGFGIEGLRNRSRAPKRVANKKDLSGELSTKLVELHEREPGLTRLQILVILAGEASADIATMSWISRTRKRLGLTGKRRAKNNEHKIRYEVAVPGFLQIDTKTICKDGETAQKLYQFTAIDECTRVRFLGGSLTKGAMAATKFLKMVIAFYNSIGIQVVRAQTDNGTEFTLPRNEATMESYARGETQQHIFTRECERQGIRHRLIKPGTPELNGKVERSHRIDINSELSALALPLDSIESTTKVSFRTKFGNHNVMFLG